MENESEDRLEDTARNAAAAPVLLTGVTGFVGGQLAPALVAAGHAVRGLTRNLQRSRDRFPTASHVTLVAGDTGDERSLERALAGCKAAFYLVHGMAEGKADFRRREVAAAQRFATAAAKTDLERIVYLGGVAPASEGDCSEHLRSRLEVGEVLRAGRVPTIELRASMIVGHGSQSWLIVRDLAARLPFMVLPRWLESKTQPVAIDDVVIALVRALALPIDRMNGHVNVPIEATNQSNQSNQSQWFDIPGPEILSGREILIQTSAAMGLPSPRIVEVPLLTPWLSSHWVHLVTRADWSVARELVLGLRGDLLAKDNRYWHLIDHPRLVPFNDAAALTLAAERRAGPIGGAWGIVERLRSMREPAGKPA